MNCKCAHFWGAISLFSLVLIVQVQAIPDPYNGRFELYDYNNIIDINTPTGWQHENYTAVVGHFTPHPFPNQGKPTNWKLDPNIGLFPFEGQHFLVLSTGDVSTEPNYAKAWQSITVEAGYKLTGVYFFGTCDYVEPRYYNDWAEIDLVPTTDPNLQELQLVRMAVSDVGNYGSMKGWERFEHTFEANQAGTYDLIIFISDYDDKIWDSYFAVDGFVLCRNASNGGDINLDCTTDFQDFVILAADWLCDCNDPNNYNDPNDNCRLNPDLTGEDFIDTNDLQVISENWLQGTKE